MALRLTLIGPDGTERTRSTAIGADILTMFPPSTDAPTPAQIHERRMQGLAYAWQRRPSRQARQQAQDVASDYRTVELRQVDEYAADKDALVDQLAHREADVMRTARHWGSSVDDLCKLYNYLRKCERLWTEAGQRDLRAPVVLQCEYWALTFKEAAEIAGVRALQAHGRDRQRAPISQDKHTAHGRYSARIYMVDDESLTELLTD